jgi:hypothetical protein
MKYTGYEVLMKTLLLCLVLVTTYAYSQVEDLPPDSKFEALYDCYQGIGGTVDDVTLIGAKQNFIVIHVGGIKDSQTVSNDVKPNADNFLILNKQGARFFTPVPIKDAKKDTGPWAYYMTVQAPGEKKEIQVSYNTYLKDGSCQPSFFGLSSGKEIDAQFAQHRGDPAKPMSFGAALTILSYTSQHTVDELEEAMTNGKYARGMNSYMRMPATNTERLDHERGRVTRQMDHLRSCEKIGDDKLLAQAQRAKTLLGQQTEILNKMAQPEGLRPMNPAGPRR